jgi:hypothetical protein
MEVVPKNVLMPILTHTAERYFNENFKFIAKACAARISPIAHRIIDRCQTAFIKRRVLNKGVLAIQEIVHDVRVKELGGHIS